MDRFWSKVDRGDPDECWQWQGTVTGGYGMTRFKPYRDEGAHRVALKLDDTEVPDDMQVMHKCDNPLCVNPNHLKVGTAEENMQHAREAGSHAKKLTEDDVRDIRNKAEGNVLTQEDIAELYDIHPMTVSKIVRRKTWQHVD